MQNQNQMSNFKQKQTFDKRNMMIDDSKFFSNRVNTYQIQEAADLIDYSLSKCWTGREQNLDSSYVDSLNSTENIPLSQIEFSQSQEQRNKLGRDLSEIFSSGNYQNNEMKLTQSDKTKKQKKQQQKQQNTLNEEIKNFEERITNYTQEQSPEDKYCPKIPEVWVKKFQIQKKRK